MHKEQDTDMTRKYLAHFKMKLNKTDKFTFWDETVICNFSFYRQAEDMTGSAGSIFSSHLCVVWFCFDSVFNDHKCC